MSKNISTHGILYKLILEKMLKTKVINKKPEVAKTCY